MADLNKDTETVLKVPCDVYSRIVGYMTPTNRWNDGKKQEFADRVTFDRAVHEAVTKAARD